MVEATPHIISVEVVGEKAVIDGKVEYNIIGSRSLEFDSVPGTSTKGAFFL